MLLVALLLGLGTCAPLQLVYPNEDHTRLLVNESALAVLRTLPPLPVVSVVGALHSGKSFLLNALAGQAFPLGKAMGPETMGIWMSEAPVEIGGRRVLVLDTEGLSAPGVSSVYDAKMFSVAVLLSSRCLFQTIRSVGQEALESIEMMARRSSLFSLRSAEAPVTPLPAMTLVLRDFFTELPTTCTQWLRDELLSAPRRDDGGAHLPETLDSAAALFPALECVTLGFPHASPLHLDRRMDELLPSFLEDIERLRGHIATTAVKQLGGEPASGEMLGSFLLQLLESANTEAFPMVPSQWASYVEQQLKSSASKSEARFKETTSEFPVRPVGVYASMLDEERTAAFVFWEQQLMGFRNLEAPREELSKALDVHQKLMVERNKYRIEQLVSSHETVVVDGAEQAFTDLKLPVASHEFHEHSSRIIEAQLLEFSSHLEGYEVGTDAVLKRLDEKRAVFEGRNRALIQKRFEGAQRESIALFEECATVKNPPLREAPFKSKADACEGRATAQFGSMMKAWKSENQFSVYRAALKAQLQDKLTAVSAIYVKAVARHARSVAAPLHSDLEAFSDRMQQRLPLPAEELDEASRTLFQELSRKLDEKLAGYTRAHYSSVTNKLKSDCQKTLHRLTQENVRLTREMVRDPLNQLRGEMRPAVSEFWLESSFNKYVTQRAERILAKKVTSTKLRSQVVASWVSSLDEERTEVTSWQIKAFVGVPAVLLLVAGVGTMAGRSSSASLSRRSSSIPTRGYVKQE